MRSRWWKSSLALVALVTGFLAGLGYAGTQVATPAAGAQVTKSAHLHA